MTLKIKTKYKDIKTHYNLLKQIQIQVDFINRKKQKLNKNSTLVIMKSGYYS